MFLYTYAVHCDNIHSKFLTPVPHSAHPIPCPTSGLSFVFLLNKPVNLCHLTYLERLCTILKSSGYSEEYFLAQMINRPIGLGLEGGESDVFVFH